MRLSISRPSRGACRALRPWSTGLHRRHLTLRWTQAIAESWRGLRTRSLDSGPIRQLLFATQLMITVETHATDLDRAVREAAAEWASAIAGLGYSVLGGMVFMRLFKLLLDKVGRLAWRGEVTARPPTRLGSPKQPPVSESRYTQTKGSTKGKGNASGGGSDGVSEPGGGSNAPRMRSRLPRSPANEASIRADLRSLRRQEPEFEQTRRFRSGVARDLRQMEFRRRPDSWINVWRRLCSPARRNVTVGMRPGSQSGGATVDVTFPNGKYMKVHIQ